MNNYDKFRLVGATTWLKWVIEHIKSQISNLNQIVKGLGVVWKDPLPLKGECLNIFLFLNFLLGHKSAMLLALLFKI